VNEITGEGEGKGLNGKRASLSAKGLWGASQSSRGKGGLLSAAARNPKEKSEKNIVGEEVTVRGTGNGKT